jgi:hypothetical protein
MTVSIFSLGDAAISQAAPIDEGKSKTPPKRTVLAKADATVAPEPR